MTAKAQRYVMKKGGGRVIPLDIQGTLEKRIGIEYVECDKDGKLLAEGKAAARTTIDTSKGVVNHGTAKNPELKPHVQPQPHVPAPAPAKEPAKAPEAPSGAEQPQSVPATTEPAPAPAVTT